MSLYITGDKNIFVHQGTKIVDEVEAIATEEIEQYLSVS